MGREIVYCEGCGKRLTEDDFTRGKAQDYENRPFCSPCRPVAEPSSSGASEGQPPPAPSRKVTERRTAGASSGRRNSTERIPYADAPPGTRRQAAAGNGPSAAWIIGGIGAALTFVIVAGMAMTSQRPALPPDVKPSHDLAAEVEAQLRQKEKDRLVEIERAKRLVAEREAADRKAAAEREEKNPAADRETAEKKAAAEREAAEKKAAAEKEAQKAWFDLFIQATNRIQVNDYPGAKKIYLEGLAKAPETRPEDLQQRAVYCIGLYNLACICAMESAKLADPARAPSVDAAFKYLDWALRSDYGKFRCPCHPQTLGIGHMGEDKDMEPLRKDARYAELLKKYR
jgi:hypothetical protein